LGAEGPPSWLSSLEVGQSLHLPVGRNGGRRQMLGGSPFNHQRRQPRQGYHKCLPKRSFTTPLSQNQHHTAKNEELASFSITTKREKQLQTLNSMDESAETTRAYCRRRRNSSQLPLAAPHHQRPEGDLRQPPSAARQRRRHAPETRHLARNLRKTLKPTLQLYREGSPTHHNAGDHRRGEGEGPAGPDLKKLEEGYCSNLRDGRGRK
jgi:hypothetical protein